MFTALLVDDESWSLMGLKDSLNWEEAGLRIVYETTNSLDALETIERIRPDVVFTDIRMPVLSGIELIGKCRDRGAGAEFVLVSGYAEFEYAKHALQYGAFDYLLKPINEEELGKLVSRLVLRLSEKAIMAKTSVSVYASGDFDFDLAYGASGFQRRHSLYRACVLNDTDPDAIAEVAEIAAVSAVTLKAGFRKQALLLNYEPEAEEALKRALSHLTGEQGASGFAGLSEPSREADWNKLLEQAFKAASERFFNPKACVRHYTPMDQGAVRAWFDRFLGVLASRSAKDFREICDGLPETFGQAGFGVEALEYFHNGAAALLRYKYGDRFAEAKFEPLTYDGLTAKYKNAADYADFVHQTCDAVAFAQPKETASDEAFGKLLDHIDSHFGEELYLTDLARNFHFSLTYLCEVFRKKTGKTFTKYLNDLRLERAKEHMLLTDLSIAEIAEKTGFKDYFYFSKLFKKTFGASPSYYRKGEQAR